jgi:hypothetical protein
MVTPCESDSGFSSNPPIESSRSVWRVTDDAGVDHPLGVCTQLVATNPGDTAGASSVNVP